MLSHSIHLSLMMLNSSKQRLIYIYKKTIINDFSKDLVNHRHFRIQILKNQFIESQNFSPSIEPIPENAYQLEKCNFFGLINI